jgi:hypothetical protein
VGQQPLPSNYVLLGAMLDLDLAAGHGWAQHVHGDGIIEDVARQDFTTEQLEELITSILGQLNGELAAGEWPMTIKAWFQPTLF